MTDIPQEVREAAKRVFIEALTAYNTALVLTDREPIKAGLKEAAAVVSQSNHAMFLAGKRAGRVEGMERAAEIAEAIKREAEGSIVSCHPDGLASAALKGNVSAARHIAQAIRSENDG